MNLRIQRSNKPSANYTALLRQLYGHSPVADRYLQDTLLGLDFVSQSPSVETLFLHATDTDTPGNQLVGHIGLILSSGKQAFFGFFEATEQAVFAQLWQQLLARAQSNGVQQLFGPVNGTVWHPYRLISETTQEPHFLCEPLSLPGYCQWFQAVQPATALGYHSAYRSNFKLILETTAPSVSKARANGIQITQHHSNDALLQDLHQLATEVFSGNPGYTPLDFINFKKLYGEQENEQAQSVVFMATQNGKNIGFSYNVLTQGKLIMKTIGVLPNWQEQGVGNAMVHAAHCYAQEQGVGKVVYALIRADNKVRHFPTNDVTIFRKYAAFLYLLS